MRYVVGTKLQMKSGKSHKKNTCKYHDVSLAREGSRIKTMNQVPLSLIYITPKKTVLGSTSNRAEI